MFLSKQGRSMMVVVARYLAWLARLNLGKLESNLYQAKTIHSNLEVFIAELSSSSAVQWTFPPASLSKGAPLAATPCDLVIPVWTMPT